MADIRFIELLKYAADATQQLADAFPDVGMGATSCMLVDQIEKGAGITLSKSERMIAESAMISGR